MLVNGWEIRPMLDAYVIKSGGFFSLLVMLDLGFLSISSENLTRQIQSFFIISLVYYPYIRKLSYLKC